MGESDPLDEAFAALLADFDNDELHKRFLALAQATGRLPDAGRRYRELKDAEPARAAAVQKRLDALLAVALADLAQRRPVRDDRPKQRLFWVALGVALFIAASAIYQLVRYR